MHVRDRRQETLREDQKHKDSRTPVKNAIANLGTTVEYCPHCMTVRTLHLTREAKSPLDNKDEVHEAVLTCHCESCGTFIRSELLHPASWDSLINSLGKSSDDFMVERMQPKNQKRQGTAKNKGLV